YNHYLDEVIRPRLSSLQAETVLPDAIIEYLAGLREAFENLESMPATNGCFLINTANSPIASDPEVSRVVTDYWNELETDLRGELRLASRRSQSLKRRR
ncbi:TetR/AcrR family transcriptional regulator, partial [Neomicrococcus lactis]